jgi:soluble lytic murein transglycosylase
MIARLLLAALLALAPAAAAAAQIPVPRIRPAPDNHSAYLTDADFNLFRAGLDAAEDEDWDEVRQIRGELTDIAARRILLWRAATSDPRAEFFELDLALRDLAGWPRESFIRREAETKIGDSGLAPAFIVAWFEEHPAVTGPGRIAHAEALLAIDRIEEGEAVLREAWRSNRFALSRQSEVLNAHRSRLRQEDHVARVDYLIWSSQRTAARRLVPLLDGGERRIAEARLRLAGRQSGVDAAVRAVPASMRNDPGLVFERARWRRRAGYADDRLPLLLELPGQYDDTNALEAMWTERKLMILTLIREQDFQTAYELASAHGMERGGDFADAEFLSGWLSLTHLGEPERAYGHFEHLAGNVSTPVSLSRGFYWMARAADEMGRPDLAAGHYAIAAEHSTAYYGQLALASLGEAGDDLALQAEPEPSAEAVERFEARREVRALHLLAELGEDYYFRLFMYAIDDRLEDPEEMVLLSRLARDYLRLRQSVRAAKAARQRGIILPQSAYPTIDLPESARIRPEDALVHSVIRQETEFEQRAISGAGARGIMQLMPATARQTARQLGQPYRRNWLTDDPDYNLTLGMAHLEEVVEDYNGSYVVALAAYNAGGHRASRWIRDYGDPRTGEIDPIDWVESIPFSETRNYVMRVMENLQVYRSRLDGDAPAPLMIEEDLMRGAPDPS